jgi:hypothetical protein
LVLLPSNILRAIAVMQVEVQDSGMGQTMSYGGIGDAYVNIVDPAKS